jgi:RimJ/RimL family protein N-acetyltransferase
MADLADIAALSWPKRTERLTLRPITEEDVEALWQIRRQESVGRWMTSTSTDRHRFAELMADPDRMAKTLVILAPGPGDRAGEVVIGDLMIAPEDAWAQAEVADEAAGTQAEIGWCIDPAAEGQGFATEAVRELIRVAFEELGLRRVFANCFAANESSWRLMERLGMRREALNRKDSLHRTGEWMDGTTYALLADEWRGAQPGLS